MVGLGLENIIAVETNDAIFIAHKNRAQEIKDIVVDLKDKNSEATQHKKYLGLGVLTYQ